MAYAVPGPMGGKLIRKVLALTREIRNEKRITSHILIACSGGSDSTALSVLLTRYGRNFALKANLSLLHVNHGWRAEASDGDERFVRRLAKKLGVPVITERLQGPSEIPNGESWEENARRARQAIYRRLTAEGGLVVTAHHADDLAETALWRLFTGSDSTHGGGIQLRAESELRPLLTVRKSELLAFLREERQSYRQDSTNQDERFLRARMRARLMPELERLFPRAIEHLTSRALAIQASAQSLGDERLSSLESLVSAAGIRLRQSHYRSLKRAPGAELHLPGGWRLRGSDPKHPERWPEQWRLEKLAEPSAKELE